VEEDILGSLENGIGRAFGREILRLRVAPDPVFAFDARRGQYSSTLILNEIIAESPGGGGMLLAVTGVDLFIPMLSFVFGQAQVGGMAALMSVARLRQEFYGLPPDDSLLRKRALKECVHELGHAFGLVHCADVGCPMSLSHGIHQVDLKNTEFCESCVVRLAELMNTGTNATLTSRRSLAG
jgi:archaemetzincin